MAVGDISDLLTLDCLALHVYYMAGSFTDFCVHNRLKTIFRVAAIVLSCFISCVIVSIRPLAPCYRYGVGQHGRRPASRG